MKFNTEYIIIISILGIILLYSYYYFAQKDNVLKLWGRLKGNFLYVYYASMLLSLIGFLFLFYYLFLTHTLTKDQINKMFISLIVIITVSTMWMPLSLYYLKHKEDIYKYLIIFILLIVAFSILYFITVLNNVTENKYILEKKLALAGMIYFFIHCFFFDSLMWSYNFF